MLSILTVQILRNSGTKNLLISASNCIVEYNSASDHIALLHISYKFHFNIISLFLLQQLFAFYTLNSPDSIQFQLPKHYKSWEIFKKMCRFDQLTACMSLGKK